MKNKIPLHLVRKIIEIISISLLAGYLFYLLSVWPSLPTYVATRWNSMGIPNGWGNKLILFAPPIVMVGLYFLFYIFVHFSSSRIQKSKKNEISLKISILFSGFKPFFILLFWYLTICSVHNFSIGHRFILFFFFLNIAWIVVNLLWIKGELSFLKSYLFKKGEKHSL